MLNDLKDNIKAVAAMHPAEYSATKADNPIIDLQGYESCAFIVQTGAISAADGSNTYTFTVEHLSLIPICPCRPPPPHPPQCSPHPHQTNTPLSPPRRL